MMNRTRMLFALLLVFLAYTGCSSSDCPNDPCEKLDVIASDQADSNAPLDAVEDIQLDFTDVNFEMPDFGIPPDGASPCDETPYEFGCPCGTNSDCLSGYCVEGPQGFVCSTECLEDCPDDWQCKGIQGYGADLVFLCVPKSNKLCFPCELDSQCSGGACVTLEDASYCTYGCSASEPCPASFDCVAHPDAEETVCIPRSNTCLCTFANEGEKRPCTTSNDLGECQGFESCQPDVGFVGCTAPTPVAETCDYFDNDCDGLIDEDFTDESGTYSDNEHCGSCTTSCVEGFPNGVSYCNATFEVPRCMMQSCNPGFFLLNDYQCVPNVASLCEPCQTDANCSGEGSHCVELADGFYCARHCETTGDCPSGYECLESGGDNQCIPATNSCTCDGTNTALSKSCSRTWPENPLPDETYSTCSGIQQCTDDGWSECQVPEEICDALDNDCNGQVDDGFMVDGQYIADTDCGSCGNNCALLNQATAVGVCDATGTVPVCVLSCHAGFFDINENPSDGCECEFVSNQDLPDGIDQNCDGIDGEVGNGLFVAKNGHDDNTGTRELPLLTISAAISKAQTDSVRDVYVATGVYSASVTLKAGVQVYGGYSSDFETRDTILYETVIMGTEASPSTPGAVTGTNISGSNAAVLDGFTIYGHDNKNPGASSYAVYLSNCGDAVTISNCHVIAGDGAKGVTGQDGIDGGDGNGGNSGNNALETNSEFCPTGQTIVAGGSAGGNSCGGTDLSGGRGGHGICPNPGTAPAASELGSTGKGSNPGSGGDAGWDAAFTNFNNPCGTCSVDPDKISEGQPGGNGANGVHGTPGSGCTAGLGNVQGGLWVPGTGNSGLNAGHGSGGGGGGAGQGSYVQWAFFADGECYDEVGGAGGGGGSGACGGTGGTAGSGGGASFGIFLYFDGSVTTQPVLLGNLVEAGVGGDGGDGGAGGTGGVGGEGGLGGTGGTGDAWCTSGGGQGGKGGNGGHGGGGGGGCGGDAYGVYVHGASGASLQSYKDDNWFVFGQAGQPGSGGPSIGNPGADGASGTIANTNF